MLILIATGLAVLYALLKPMSDGLFETSLWVAKIVTPADSEDNGTTRQIIKMGQAALMDGWLSNIPFISAIFIFASIVVAFFYSWWAAILIYFTAGLLGQMSKLFWTRPASYYLLFLHHKMINRAVDYKMKNDLERSEEHTSELQSLRHLVCRLLLEKT